MINHIEENHKALYLDWLYDNSGRTCCTYTGLYRQRIAELIERDMREVLGDGHD